MLTWIVQNGMPDGVFRYAQRNIMEFKDIIKGIIDVAENAPKNHEMMRALFSLIDTSDQLSKSEYKQYIKAIKSVTRSGDQTFARMMLDLPGFVFEADDIASIAHIAATNLQYGLVNYFFDEHIEALQSKMGAIITAILDTNIHSALDANPAYRAETIGRILAFLLTDQIAHDELDNELLKDAFVQAASLGMQYFVTCCLKVEAVKNNEATTRMALQSAAMRSHVGIVAAIFAETKPSAVIKEMTFKSASNDFLRRMSNTLFEEFQMTKLNIRSQYASRETEKVKDSVTSENATLIFEGFLHEFDEKVLRKTTDQELVDGATELLESLSLLFEEPDTALLQRQLGTVTQFAQGAPLTTQYKNYGASPKNDPNEGTVSPTSSLRSSAQKIY